MLIKTGHGYETGEYGRCTAFDGYEVLTNPLGGYDKTDRESRVFGRKENGNGGTCYGSYVLKLAKGDNRRDLYLLVQHGSGREVWRMPTFYDGGVTVDIILTMPDRVQYGMLMTMYKLARDTRAQAQTETRQEWAQAYVDGRIKKHRATKSRGARVEILPHTN